MRYIPAVVALTLMLLVMALGQASAHATLVSADPSRNASLASSPPAVTLTFSETIDGGYSRIQVFDASGGQVDLKDSGVSATEERVLRISLPPLPDGVYTVSWRVLSKVDGHVTKDTYIFTVGEATAGGGGAGSGYNSAPPIEEVAARWGGFLGQAVALGGFGFLLLVWLPTAAALGLRHNRSGSAPAYTGIPAISALLSLVASTGLLASLGALLLIFSTSASDGELLQGLGVATTNPYGRSLLIRSALAAAMAFLSFQLHRIANAPQTSTVPRPAAADGGGAGATRGPLGIFRGFLPPQRLDLRPLWTWALIGLAVAAAATVVTSSASHAAATAGTLGTVADVTHLAALSLWVGGLFHMGLAAMPKLARSGSPRAGPVAAEAAANFTALGTLMVAVVVLSGTYLSLVTVASPAGLLNTLHGQTLLVKLLIFAPLVGVGAYNHFLMRPRLDHTRDLEEDSRIHRRRFLTTIRLEAILGATILLAAGLLTALTPAAVQGPGTPGGYIVERTSGDIVLRLEVYPYPAGPAKYDFNLFLTYTNGSAYYNATNATLALTPGGGGAVITVVLQPLHGYHFIATAEAFAERGTWKLTLTLLRNDGGPISTNFFLAVG